MICKYTTTVVPNDMFSRGVSQNGTKDFLVQHGLIYKYTTNPILNVRHPVHTCTRLRTFTHMYERGAETQAESAKRDQPRIGRRASLAGIDPRAACALIETPTPSLCGYRKHSPHTRTRDLPYANIADLLLCAVVPFYLPLRSARQFARHRVKRQSTSGLKVLLAPFRSLARCRTCF